MFIAKFQGTCGAECDDPIQIGDPVEYVGTVLVHSMCANEDVVVANYIAQAPLDTRPHKFQGTSLDEMGY